MPLIRFHLFLRSSSELFTHGITAGFSFSPKRYRGIVFLPDGGWSSFFRRTFMSSIRKVPPWWAHLPAPAWSILPAA
jgi:hypothetical protein